MLEDEKLEKHLVTPFNISSLSLIQSVDEKILKDLKGLLSVQDKQVYIVDDSFYDKRINFIQSHEYAHWMIPSHNKLLFKCTQFDLARSARQQLEREANYFAGELGFMQGKFFEYLQSSSLSMQHVKNLSDIFKFSNESTLWRAVELEIRPCALMCFKINKETPNGYLKIKYVAHSKPFEKKHGKFDWRLSFAIDSSFGKIVSEKLDLGYKSFDFEFKKNDGTKLDAELWYNGYNVIVLVQPKA